MSKHTPGPWRVSDEPGTISAPGKPSVCEMGSVARSTGRFTWNAEDRANQARIVACVNAMEGIKDPEAFVADAREVPEAVEALVGAARAMLQQLDSAPIPMSRSWLDEATLRTALEPFGEGS